MQSACLLYEVRCKEGNRCSLTPHILQDYVDLYLHSILFLPFLAYCLFFAVRIVYCNFTRHLATVTKKFPQFAGHITELWL